jgi:hypothetical protein
MRLSRLTAAATDLHAMLSELVANSERLRDELAQGREIFEVISAVADEHGRSFRRDLHNATRRFENAMQATRGESFRILMSEGSYTLAQLARLGEISPQMVKRLLRVAETDDRTDDDTQTLD